MYITQHCKAIVLQLKKKKFIWIFCKMGKIQMNFLANPIYVKTQNCTSPKFNVCKYFKVIKTILK